MKILIPLTYFGRQGGYRVLSELASHWVDLGHEVTFLAYKRSMSPYFPTTAKVQWYDNGGVIVSENDINYKKPFFKIFSILAVLRDAINRNDYDVILATLSLTAFPVYFSKKCSKKFYYVQAYEPEFYLGYSAGIVLLRNLSKLSYRLKLNIIVNSPLYFNYKEIKSNKFVYPGIDFNKFKFSKEREKNKFIVGCIGRIEPFKGTSYVLEAYQLLRRELGSDVELHIAFGDKMFEEIPGVRVTLPKSDYELADYYNSVNVIVAPGLVQHGAVHYPVIEAMACKTPVITTGYYPADETNSWLVPVRNSGSIVDAIKEIINNPKLTESRNEQAFLDTREFDWNSISKKMLRYFEYQE